MLTFVMEWLGGTVSKEDVGEETSGKRNNKRRRDDDADKPLTRSLYGSSSFRNVFRRKSNSAAADSARDDISDSLFLATLTLPVCHPWQISLFSSM